MKYLVNFLLQNQSSLKSHSLFSVLEALKEHRSGSFPFVSFGMIIQIDIFSLCACYLCVIG